MRLRTVSNTAKKLDPRPAIRYQMRRKRLQGTEELGARKIRAQFHGHG